MEDNNNTNENDAGDRNPVPEHPKFPEGLRVLAVDDDTSCLEILTVMLRKCNYKVTPTTNATEALALLRKNKENYDIVITDVKMPDMDGFELLRIISLEMDIPVIMMSEDDNTENVMKGVRHGARDYLLKPIRILELKNIWQHVMRKTVFNPEKLSLMTEEIVMGNLPLKKRKARDKEKTKVCLDTGVVSEEVETRKKLTNVCAPSDGVCTPSDGVSSMKSAPSDGVSSMKKRRFAWTLELHEKFVDAVHQLDADKAVPKQIVEIMNEPELTREIVASHLQKYRKFLKKRDDTTEECSYNAGQKRTHEPFLNPTPASYSENKVLPMPREANNCSSSSKISFRDHLSKSDTLSNSRLNESLVNGSLNQQSMWSQQMFNSPQMLNQAQPPKPISVLGNAPLAQSWMANPSRRMMYGDYVDMSSQIPNFGVAQSGPPLGFANFARQSGHSSLPPCKLPPTENASYQGPPSVFGIVGTPYQMPEGASTQIGQPFQRNALPGQHHGRVVSTPFNGGVGSDCRGYPADFQAMDKSRGTGQGTYTQLLTENIDNKHHNNSSSVDEELSTEVKESSI